MTGTRKVLARRLKQCPNCTFWMMEMGSSASSFLRVFWRPESKVAEGKVLIYNMAASLSAATCWMSWFAFASAASGSAAAAGSA